MDEAKAILTVQDLHVGFDTMLGTVNALNGIDLSIERDRVHCLVGESGCGKSVTARAIMRILGERAEISRGTVTFDDGEDHVVLTDGDEDDAHLLRIRGSRISMIFQEPMSAFSPVHTVGDQITEMLLLHERVSKEEALERAIATLKDVGIQHAEEVVRMYVYQLSGGMRQRAMIAMALMCRPSILIADEPTTSLDVTIQAQILDLIRREKQRYGMTVVLITHDMGVVAEMADTVSVMYLGRIIENGTVREIFRNPLHPYTKKLLGAVPRITRKRGRTLDAITGSVPDAYNIPAGCPFHPRCPSFMAGQCDTVEPRPLVVEGTHEVSCHLYTAPEGSVD